MTTNICVWYCYDSDIWMDYPKLISEKWNLTAKFNCLDGHYLMCHLHYVSLCVTQCSCRKPVLKIHERGDVSPHTHIFWTGFLHGVCSSAIFLHIHHIYRESNFLRIGTLRHFREWLKFAIEESNGQRNQYHSLICTCTVNCILVLVVWWCNVLPDASFEQAGIQTLTARINSSNSCLKEKLL